MVAKASGEETGKQVGEGIEIVKNEPYVENEHGLPPGQYTEKIFYLKSKIPRFIAAVIPDSAMELVEYSWNAFPKCLTIYENRFLGEKFHLSVESMHANDRGTQENANNLSKAELKVREVEYLNIADKNNNVAITKDADPTTFQSIKTGRGPLTKDFAETCEPYMCAYKVVRLQFKVFGLQKKVEAYGHFYGIRNPFIDYHRKLFCWIDEWFGLKLSDIRLMESEIQRTNKEKLANSQDRSANAPTSTAALAAAT